MADSSPQVGEAIAALRLELTNALSAGAGEGIHFRLGPVELEFLVDVKREVGGKGGIKFWLISLEGKGDMTQSSLQRIKLKLQPIEADTKEDLEVASNLTSRPR